MHCSATAGFMYHKGRGLPQHNKLAILWFRRAAEMGDAKAMLNLGVMYYRGKGTRKDYVLAHMWFGLAHQLGNQVGGDGPPTEKQASE
jgi:TPR repeat protein